VSAVRDVLQADEAVPFRYGVFGLTLVSDFELSGLPFAGEGPAAPSHTVTIARGIVRDPAIVAREPMAFVDRGGEQLLAWTMVGAFRIASHDRIEVEPNDGVSDSLVALPLLGAVLATLLHRRGLVLFHASAVSVNGLAVALLGDKGAGKSTAAAALVAAGHQLISDDIVGLDYHDPDHPLVLPAWGQVKLWDDSGAQLGETGIVEIGRLHRWVDKSHYSLAAGQFASKPVPLARLFVLGRSETPKVRPLPAPDALRQLLRHSYMARFGGKGLGDGFATHFARSARMVKDRMVRGLDAPAGLDRLHEVAGLVEADLGDA